MNFFFPKSKANAYSGDRKRGPIALLNRDSLILRIGLFLAMAGGFYVLTLSEKKLPPVGTMVDSTKVSDAASAKSPVPANSPAPPPAATKSVTPKAPASPPSHTKRSGK